MEDGGLAVSDWKKLERLALYLLGEPGLVAKFDFVVDPDLQEPVCVYSDTDRAGCRKTRRSTTGGCLL